MAISNYIPTLSVFGIFADLFIIALDERAEVS